MTPSYHHTSPPLRRHLTDAEHIAAATAIYELALAAHTRSVERRRLSHWHRVRLFLSTLLSSREGSAVQLDDDYYGGSIDA